MPALEDRIEDFCDRLRQRRIESSSAAARGTAELLRQVIASSKASDPKGMLEEVKSVGIRIQSAKPIELVIGNIVRRVMYIIREEIDEQADEDTCSTGTPSEPSPQNVSPVVAGGLSRALGNPLGVGARLHSRSFSLHNLLDQTSRDDSGIARNSVASLLQTPSKRREEAESQDIRSAGDAVIKAGEEGGELDRQGKKSTGTSLPPWEGKQDVIDGVNELIDELKDIDAAIAVHAPEHIHANELILTFGFSRTVLRFLKRGREKRDFQAVVAEGAPTLEGQKMAVELAKSGIRTTLITDAAVFAMMARVNKVIISAHALLADGGVMAPVGTAVVAAAAKRHSVPFVVLVGIYKLSPNFPHEPGVSFNDFKDPSAVLPYSDLAVLQAETFEMKCNGEGKEKEDQSTKPFLQVQNPSYDYIPPENISLFLTDHGHGFIPSYVYRQLSEFYAREDYELLPSDLETMLAR